jgi:hypothetical protein
LFSNVSGAPDEEEVGAAVTRALDRAGDDDRRSNIPSHRIDGNAHCSDSFRQSRSLWGSYMK